jgi:hypothetical protein
MKQSILNKIEELGENVSFVDLMALPGSAGYYEVSIKAMNWVYWGNVSYDLCMALHELQSEGLIEYDLTDPMTYVIDGITINLPLVRKDVKYKSPRWLPVVLNKGPNFYQDQVEQVA